MNRSKELMGVLAVAVLVGCTASQSQAVVTGWMSSTHVKGGSDFVNLAVADDAIATGTTIGSGLAPVVNYLNSGGDGNFGGGFQPFGLGGPSNQFAVLSTGKLKVTMAGTYQFGNNTDDGSRLRLDLNQNGVFEASEDIIVDNVLSGPHNAFSAPIVLNPGLYNIEHMWYERGGGAEGESFIQKDGQGFALYGKANALGASAFGITVTQVPEPTTALLGLMGIAGLVARRRRAA